nr:uncharacterized protein LOC131796463 [Pocillopora verrucosa]
MAQVFDSFAGFPFRLRLNGTEEPLRLSGAASIAVSEDNITALYLDGSPLTYAVMPAIPILTTGFGISVWIKLLKYPNSFQPIYGDWSSNASFALSVNEDGRLCTEAKRQAPATGNVFSICGNLHDIPLNKWTHVGMSWRKSLRKLLLFINGKTFEDIVHKNPVLSFKNSGRLLHDIGFREDTGNTIQAYMSDFVIIDREKNGKNFVEEFFESHPLSKFT